MDARVIKLAPEDSVARVITFDELSEEHSEARGRGRARRQRRRMERIENKDERRSARRARRSSAQADRQAIREQRLEARMLRRKTRAEGRAERKGIRHPEEENQNQPPVNNGQGGGQGTGEQQGGGEPPRALPPDQPIDSGQQGGGNGDTTEGSNVGQGDYSSQGGGRGNSGGSYDEGTSDSEDDGYGDEGGSDSEDDGYGDEGGSDSEDDGYGFDGVMGAEDRYVELSDDDNVQRISVTPQMIDQANKYEWNKELVCRLIMKKADEANKGNDVTDINKEIAERKNRMSEIKSSFDNYLNYDCDFSNACGCAMSGADGLKSYKRTTPRKRTHRQAEVRAALETARDRRNAIKTGSAANKMVEKENKIRYYGGDVTPVEENLNPEFSKNKIVIPQEEKSNFDNTNGLGYANDLDAPPTREVFLNFDGKTATNILMIGAVAIVGYLVYKEIKKM